MASQHVALYAAAAAHMDGHFLGKYCICMQPCHGCHRPCLVTSDDVNAESV